jgi:hypothetical protein
LLAHRDDLNFDLAVALCGAGAAAPRGFARHLRAHRDELTRSDAIVLELGPCAHGEPAYVARAGALIPLRLHQRLGELAAEQGIPATRPWSRGAAQEARRRGVPSIALIGSRGDESADALDGQAPARMLAIAHSFALSLSRELSA